MENFKRTNGAKDIIIQAVVLIVCDYMKCVHSHAYDARTPKILKLQLRFLSVIKTSTEEF